MNDAKFIADKTRKQLPPIKNPMCRRSSANKRYFGQADNPEPDAAEQALPWRPRYIPPSPIGHVRHLAASIGAKQHRKTNVNRSLTLNRG